MGLFNRKEEMSDTARELEEYNRRSNGAYNNGNFYSSSQQGGYNNSSNSPNNNFYGSVPQNGYNNGNNSNNNASQNEGIHFYRGTRYTSTANPQNENNSTKKGSKLKGVFVLILMMFAFISIGVMARINPMISMIIFGLLFLVLGICACFSNKEKRNYQALVFAAIGAVITVVAIILLLGTEEFLISMEMLFPYIFLSIFFLLGLALIIVPKINIRKKQQRCTYKTVATVVDLRRKRGENRGYVYCPVYEYIYNNISYSIDESIYKNFNVPKIGDKFEILINPNKPTDTYVKGKGNSGFVLIGALFMAFSAAMMVMIAVLPNLA